MGVDKKAVLCYHGLMAKSSSALVLPRPMADTSQNYRYFNRRRNMSPVVARALDLWSSGAVKSRKAAAEAVGLSPQTVYLVSRSPIGRQYMTTAHEIIQEKTIDTSVLIEKLSRRAVEVIGTMMEDAEKEDIRFRAAQDLADRGKETAKITKVQSENFMIGAGDVAALADAMVKAAQLKTQYAEVADKGYIRLEDGGQK